MAPSFPVNKISARFSYVCLCKEMFIFCRKKEWDQSLSEVIFKVFFSTSSTPNHTSTNSPLACNQKPLVVADRSARSASLMVVPKNSFGGTNFTTFHLYTSARGMDKCTSGEMKLLPGVKTHTQPTIWESVHRVMTHPVRKSIVVETKRNETEWLRRQEEKKKQLTSSLFDFVICSCCCQNLGPKWQPWQARKKASKQRRWLRWNNEVEIRCMHAEEMEKQESDWENKLFLFPLPSQIN